MMEVEVKEECRTEWKKEEGRRGNKIEKASGSFIN